MSPVLALSPPNNTIARAKPALETADIMRAVDVSIRDRQ